MAQTAAQRRAAAKKAAATRKKNAEQENGDTPDENGDEDAPTESAVEEYQPRHPELENAGLDQHEAEAKRQSELQVERDEHNRRTGDASR